MPVAEELVGCPGSDDQTISSVTFISLLTTNRPVNVYTVNDIDRVKIWVEFLRHLCDFSQLEEMGVFVLAV